MYLESARRRGVAVGLAIALAIVLWLAFAAASKPPRAHAADADRERSCGWILEPSADRENILFPDTYVRYLAAIITAPPGGYVEVKGEFPHSRYMSLQTYSHTLQSADNLRDVQIAPDPGSTNPFQPGADRNATSRSYTVKLVSGAAPPGGGPPNTLYNTSPDGTKTGFGLAYRIYLPDRGSGPFGGVHAPHLAIVLPGGQRIPLPECPDLIPDVGATQTLAGLGLSDYFLPELGLLGKRVPEWHRYVNAVNAYATAVTDNELIPKELAGLVSDITAALPSGLGENADNKYVYANLTQEFGRVVEFRAKMPTAPRTRDGDAVMGGGQMRYWSMCTGNHATMAYACVADEDVPVDRDGYFTVAISTAAARPSNAVRECGIAWLPWGPIPKGIALMRNMLPDPSFSHSVQDSQPGTEAATLGEFYPQGRYFKTPADFEHQVGCNPPGGGAPAASPSAPAANKRHKKKKKKKRKKHRRKAHKKRHAG